MPRTTPPQGRSGRMTIVVLAAFNALTALGGGVCLAIGVLSLGDEVTPRLPWGSPVLGGIALVLTVAVPNAVLALLTVRADRRTGSVAVVVGVLLVGWIVVELTFIRELSFFHPLYAAIGFVLVRSGSRQTALLNETPPRTRAAPESPATAVVTGLLSPHQANREDLRGEQPPP